MKLFVSFASEDRETAERIALALGASHEVFFDRATLPAGGDYNAHIRNYIAGTDVLIFLISPESVRSGSYALSELEFAKDRWSHPLGHVLPVMVRRTDMNDVPNYLKAVTVLEPVGNAAAEVAAAVEKMSVLDFLNPINAGANAVAPLVDLWSSLGNRDQQAVSSIATDLTSLLEELRKTHSTIVKMASPLRRIPNDSKVFPAQFNNVYNDFRDAYDAYDFADERTHCHKIQQIRRRLQRRERPFGTEEQWQNLFRHFESLGDFDDSLIERHYVPFMARFNDAMNRINDHLNCNRISEAIDAKNDFLASLETDYDKTKFYLKQMTEAIGLLTEEL
jgi:hypothetical protein